MSPVRDLKFVISILDASYFRGLSDGIVSGGITGWTARESSIILGQISKNKGKKKQRGKKIEK